MMLDKFRDMYFNRYKLNQARKDNGHKFIGWVCTYVPEEIIYAAGITPIRILGGSEETPIADAHLYSNISSFVRNCLEEGFRNKYNFMEGFVAVNTCDHIRRLYDVWSIYLKEKTPFTHIISVPGKITEPLIDVFRKELGRFKEKLEEFFEMDITNEALRRAINIYNGTRILLKELYELRKVDSPPITGAEVMDVILAGMVTPKEEYNQLLKKLLRDIAGRDINNKDKIRLRIIGSELENSEYIKIIEDMGGIVVTDDLCNGTRYFEDLVESDSDPLKAIAKRYLYRAPCPRMRPQLDRVNHLKNMAEMYRVDGIIFESIKFCDLHAGVYPIIKQAFTELDIPILKLEREYAMAGIAQIKTRTQAFFESIGG